MESSSSAFGPFVLDRRRRTLTRAGQPVPVGTRGFVLLETLVDADGAAVSKDVLIDRAWPGAAIEESNLSVQISALRRLLGSEGAPVIVTVPRVGYRLLPPERPHAPPAQHSGPPLVAVLPFANYGADPDDEYFADGVVEDIITALSRFQAFAVMARNSTFVFKGRSVDIRTLSADIGARYILEGSVRRAGERLRVAAQFIDGATGAHLWAQNFDGRLDDVFSMQDRITDAVASRVAPSIKDAELERARRSPPRIEVYDLYLRALAVQQSTKPGTPQQLVAAAEACLALAPDFAPALGLATCGHIALKDTLQPDPDGTLHARGVNYARAALAAAGNNADVRALGGMGLISIGREYDAGIAATRQAAAENPNSVDILAYAGIGEIRCGDLDAADTFLQRAIRFNPKNAIGEWLLTGMAHVRLAQGDYVDAALWANRSYAVAPHNAVTLWILTAANALAGRMTEAQRTRDFLLEVMPKATPTVIAEGQHMRDPGRIDVIIDGLRLAGLPEG